MKNIFNPVKTFMVACDQTQTGISEQSDLYFNLITEELIHELLKEYDKKNLVGIADGIADSVWVICGFLISIDINYSNIEENILKSFDKTLVNEEKHIQDILQEYLDLRYLYKNNKKFSKKYNENYIDTFCTTLLTNLYNLSLSLNIPFQEIYDEVTRSNMSKISESGKVLKNEFGKVQKPDTYSPPNIIDILIEKGLITK